MEKLYRVPEAAERLNVKPSAVRRWVLLRKIGYVKVGERAIRIPAAEVERLIEQGTVPAREAR